MPDRTPNVLVIDDDAHMRHMVQLQMAKAPANVTVAPHGQAGLELALQSPPDLIIVDYQMPVLNGYDMCVQLKQNPETAHVPVVMLTGRGHKLSDEQLAQTNIQRMMAKPFSAKELLATAQELLQSAAENV
ncbi:MAG: response regulator [Planctomycetota bacterium]|jgi:CheY-like chemotaxis protein